jgi:hypothetical protein
LEGAVTLQISSARGGGGRVVGGKHDSSCGENSKILAKVFSGIPHSLKNNNRLLSLKLQSFSLERSQVHCTLNHYPANVENIVSS